QPLHTPPTATLLPYTTLFRSKSLGEVRGMCSFPPKDGVAAEEHGRASQVTSNPKFSPWNLCNSQRNRLTYAQFVGYRAVARPTRSEEHTSELQSPYDLVCRLL